MIPLQDQIDSGGRITDLVFDDNNQERQSRRFCNSRLPRSEVVYFTQIFITLLLIVVFVIKLLFFDLDSEESTFWFSLLSCTVGYALANAKTINKFFSPTDRLFMAVCDPSCCGKTGLIFKMLLKNTLAPNFQSILNFYQHEEPKFQALERKLDIQFFTFF